LTVRDFTPELVAFGQRLEEAAGYLDLDGLRARRQELEPEVAKPDLWNDPDAARAVTSE
jgi:peptide chain release factor 2